MPERKLVIVDGLSLLSTCYCAVLPGEIIFAKTDGEKEEYYGKILHVSDGTYTNGIIGVLKVVASLLKKQQPAYMAFVFDKTKDTFCRELHPDYKGIRSRTPEPLKQQFVLMEWILEEAGFKMLYNGRYEADNYAGSLVHKFKEQISVVVMTKDYDYLQPVSDVYNVRAWMVQARQEKAEELYGKYYGLYGLDRASVNLPEKTFEFTTETMYSEEGVWPEQITDLKGIQGDTSDNIPGVRGVTSAVPLLLGEYDTVENIYEVIHKVEQDKRESKELQGFWKNSLGISRSSYKSLTKTGEEGELCGEAAARLSKELATTKIDIPLDLELEDFSVSFYREDMLREWCGKLDIKTASVFEKGEQGKRNSGTGRYALRFRCFYVVI